MSSKEYMSSMASKNADSFDSLYRLYHVECEVALLNHGAPIDHAKRWWGASFCGCEMALQGTHTPLSDVGTVQVGLCVALFGS